MSHIAIIGGGPGGLMLARLLQVKGIAATVFERDTNAGERPQGGSLDLHAETGQHAMRAAGLEAEFHVAARPEDQGDRLYDQRGTLLFDRDGAGDDRPEIDRSALREILLSSLAPTTVRWGSKVEAIEAAGSGYAVTVNGSVVAFDIVIGADGAWSKVRPLLSPAQPVYDGVAFAEFDYLVDRDPAVAALTGTGKMFAVGDNQCLVTQRNGFGHIRGYAGWRMPEDDALALSSIAPDELRTRIRAQFSGWDRTLHPVFEAGDILAVRTLYALPIGHHWPTRAGVTLLGDAAHLMSPFAGEGVNLALADAVDLAEALGFGKSWDAVARYESMMNARATPEAKGSRLGLDAAFSSAGPAPILAHYRERYT